MYLVFFKGRDQDALNAAFRQFSQKQIQKANKPYSQASCNLQSNDAKRDRRTK